jgi:hypothetical protein
MTSKEPPVDPPAGRYCGMCERDLDDDAEFVELRSRVLVCMGCWKATPKRGGNKW